MSKDSNSGLSTCTALSLASSCFLHPIFTHLYSEMSPGPHQFHVAGHSPSLLNGMRPLCEKVLIASDHRVCRELINYSKRIFALKALLTRVHFLSWHNFFAGNCYKASASANLDASSMGSLAYHQGYIFTDCLHSQGMEERGKISFSGPQVSIEEALQFYSLWVFQMSIIFSIPVSLFSLIAVL